jgi:poly(A) polymerase/tRNA nucleotidyltransferase (CCA-adding enzyme)
MFIKHVHPDRINVELMKVMKLKDPRQFFYDCHNARLLRHIFAPLEWCWKQPGGPYHNEDVFTHCVDTCFNYPQRYPKMRWAALVHDVGKKDAARILDDGEWHFYNHELKTDSVKQWMKYLRFSEHTIKQTIGLIESHMLFDTRLTKRQARRALAILKEHDVPYCCWIHLGLADKKANRKTSRNEPIGIPTTIKILTVVESVLEEEGKFANNERNLAINGKYIMELLNIKPGPILGVVKRNLCNAIYDGECFNTFESLDGYIKRSMIEYERDYSNILLRIIPYWIVHRHFVET